MKNYLLLFSFLFVCLPNAAISASYQEVEVKLQQQLDLAQQNYRQQATSITRKRAPKLKTLYKLEKKLLGLRSDLAADIRAKDEQYLSLKQIQSRLDQWQDQNRFIHNQLNSLTNSQEQVSTAVTRLFKQRLVKLSERLNPQWQSSDAVKNSGEVVTGLLLMSGPLSWFQHNQQFYISEQLDSKSTLKIAVTASESASLAILNTAQDNVQNTVQENELKSQQNWLWLQTDITAGKATAIAAETVSYWQKLQVGGIWSYPILGFGLLSLIMVLIKFIQLIKLPRLNSSYAQDIVSSNSAVSIGSEVLDKKSSQWQQQFAVLAWQVRTYDLDKTNDQLFALLMQYKGRLERGMSLLAATAAVAPLLGLLGTVSGMIHTFEMMNLFGNKDPSLLSGGISEALFTTELGLIVAIPALLAHAYLSRQHQGYLSQLENDSVLLAHLGKPQSGVPVC